MNKNLERAKKNLRSRKGFSLVELIIVIAIMAALVAILAPQYIKYVEKSRVAADQAKADDLIKAVQVALTDPDYDAMAVNTIVMTTGGTSITTANDDTTAALNYYLSGWASQKVTNQTTTMQKYTVTIESSGGALIASGAWSAA